MTLFTRCVFVLHICFTFVLFAGFQPAHAQGLPDLDEIQRIIDEARSIVAKAKECVAFADDAQNEAESAGEEKKTAVSKASMVKSEKDKAEAAATQAEQAAAAAKAAAEAAKEAADARAAADAAADAGATVVSIASADGTTVTVPRSPTAQDLAEAQRALDDARNAVNDARDAADNADKAADEAEQAARAAREAAANAADDLEKAAEAARKAAKAARAAAVSANKAADYLTGQSFASIARHVDAAREAADAAKSAADDARDATRQAGMLTTDATDAAENSSEAATAARGHATAARRCAEHVSEREATLATIRAASAYLSRTVVNRVQKLRPAGGSSFARPARTSSGVTGLNAGDEALPDYPPNLAIDIGYSKSSGGEGLFEANSRYVLVMMDTLLTPQSLLGFGLGTEYTRESLLGGTQRRTQGLTATAYTAHILNKNLTLVPQAALTYLNKKKKFNPTPEDNEKAMRTLFSLTMLAQKQFGKVELSGFGQLAYTHEGGGENIYLGQAIAGGECAFAVKADARLFVGASMDYDIVRSTSVRDKFGWEGKVGLRSPLGSSAEFSLSISTSRKDEEETTSGNVFVKIFF